MIPTLSQIPLSPTEIQRLKQWLQSSEAALFVETLQARSYTSTFEAGNILREAMKTRDQRDKKAELVACEAMLLDSIVDEMERVANDDSLMVKLSSIIPVAPETETPTEE